jgi:hypothetical protein
MLVRFTAARAWSRSAAVTVWLLATACSLVVGDLPDPLPEGGLMAGAAAIGGGAGSESVVAGRSGAASGDEGGGDCDADDDQHPAKGACQGDDCEDGDARVWPGQTEYFADRQTRVDYDYDCSGSAEQEQLEPIVCPGVAVGACPTRTGFLKTLPACGEIGAWGTCKVTPPLDTCDQMVVDAGRRMRCR